MNTDLGVEKVEVGRAASAGSEIKKSLGDQAIEEIKDGLEFQIRFSGEAEGGEKRMADDWARRLGADSDAIIERLNRPPGEAPSIWSVALRHSGVVSPGAYDRLSPADRIFLLGLLQKTVDGVWGEKRAGEIEVEGYGKTGDQEFDPQKLRTNLFPVAGSLMLELDKRALLGVEVDWVEERMVAGIVGGEENLAELRKKGKEWPAEYGRILASEVKEFSGEVEVRVAELRKEDFYRQSENVTGMLRSLRDLVDKEVSTRLGLSGLAVKYATDVVLGENALMKPGLGSSETIPRRTGLNRLVYPKNGEVLIPREEADKINPVFNKDLALVLMVAASMVSKSPDVKKITKAHADFVLGATMGRFHGRKIIKGVFSSEALGRALRTLFVAQEVVKLSLDPLLSRVVGEVDPNDPETTESFLGNLKQDFVFPREITGGLAVMNYQIADRQDEYAVGRVVGRVIDRKNAIF